MVNDHIHSADILKCYGNIPGADKVQIPENCVLGYAHFL